MTDLHDAVRTYYLSHSKALTKDKQFHLYTRLGAWEGNQTALTKLGTMKPAYVPEPPSTEALATGLKKILKKRPSGSSNATHLRQKYFDAFPTLRATNLALFRVRHLEAVYGIDARPALQTLHPVQELLDLKEQLLADADAMRILSTFAINYIYLVEKIIRQNSDPTAIPLDDIYRLSDGYNLDDPTHVQLLIYLYTHCIIGDSNFYTKYVPKPALAVYLRMLDRLAGIISERYDSINLDNKLEFLVCARICGYKTDLFERIQAECDASVSPKGTFLIDTQNTYHQQAKKTFQTSEHRNVLFVMSGSPFVPHKTLV
jgi:hypothetical protein